MTIRVLGYVMARNEWPLLGLAITHGFNCGLDHIVVVDHASVDETAAGLERLKLKWPGRLTLIRLELDDFFQEATTRVVMSFVDTDAYDWVYVFDADEFALIPGNTSLSDLLMQVPPEVDALRYELQQWVVPEDMDDLDTAQYLRIEERAIPCVFLDQPATILSQQIKNGHTNFFDLSFPSKVIVRSRFAHKLLAGAHGIVDEPNLIEKKISAEILRIGHLPLLSWRRTKCKSAQGKSLIVAGFPKWHGWQNQMIHHLDDAGELNRFWQNHSSPKSIDNKPASSVPTTVVDDAIRIALKEAVQALTVDDQIKFDPPVEQQFTDQFKLDNLVLNFNEFKYQVANLNQSVAERDSQIANLNQSVAERDRLINALYNSNSWRITQSLRFVAHQIKRVRYIARLFLPAIEKGGGIKNTIRKAIKIYQKEGFQGIKRGCRLVATSQIASDTKDIDPVYQNLVSYPAEKLLVPRVLIIAEMSISQCKKYRVQQKQEMFGLLDVDCTVLSWCDTQLCLDALQTHSLVIFYRVPAFPGVVSIINEAKRLRLPTLWEVDDFIFDRGVLTKSRTLAALDKNTLGQLVEGADLYRKAMLMCDKGIASTSSLADAMNSAGLREVHVVENALDKQTLEVVEQLCREHAILKNDIIRIVYGSGTNTHNVDFHEATPAIIRILDLFPNVRLRIIGILDLPKTFSRYESQIERLPVCTYEEYLVNLAECDISIAPLENYIFNHSKSNIKFLEASIVKVPSVCSPRAAFSQVIINGKNGFLCETDDEWEAALKLLVTDAAKRVEVSEAAYSSVVQRYSPESVARQQVMPLLERHKRSSDTLRVLSVNCYYYPRSFGGATIVAEQVNKHVNAQEGFEIHVFTTLSSSVATPYTIKRYEDKGINIYGVGLPDYLDEKTQFENPEIIEAFAKVLAVVQPDIVHFHSIQGIGVSVVDLCAQKGIKYVVTLHDAWWLCGRQFMINKQGKYCEQNKVDLNVCATCVKNVSLNLYRSDRLAAALHNASALLAPSRFFADFYIVNGFSNVTVNKNGIVKPNSARRLRRKGDLRFGYVGGNTEIKGIHLVKKVISDLADFSVKLVLVDNTLNLGYASYHQQDLVGITDVEIVPAYNQSTIDDFFASIDVLLFPTQCKESFGLTVREALVRNVWVITTDAGGVTEDIRHGENGFIIPFDDRGQALKQAVLETIDYFKRYAVGDEICFKPDNITFFEDQAAELAHNYKVVLRR